MNNIFDINPNIMPKFKLGEMVKLDPYYKDDPEEVEYHKKAIYAVTGVHIDMKRWVYYVTLVYPDRVGGDLEVSEGRLKKFKGIDPEVHKDQIETINSNISVLL